MEHFWAAEAADAAEPGEAAEPAGAVDAAEPAEAADAAEPAEAAGPAEAADAAEPAAALVGLAGGAEAAASRANAARMAAETMPQKLRRLRRTWQEGMTQISCKLLQCCSMDAPMAPAGPIAPGAAVPLALPAPGAEDAAPGAGDAGARPQRLPRRQRRRR
jgi:hypothetical protein